MSVVQLRERYREVFGEDTRSKHRTCLWRQVAWRIQAEAEGGLSERAKRLAEELARDADVRIRVPRAAFETGAAAQGAAAEAPGRPAATALMSAVTEASTPKVFPCGVRDARLPAPGTVLARQYRGTDVRVSVREGGFEYAGRVYRTLSGVAREVTGTHWNGFHFFGLAKRHAPATGR